MPCRPWSRMQCLWQKMEGTGCSFAFFDWISAFTTTPSSTCAYLCFSPRGHLADVPYHPSAHTAEPSPSQETIGVRKFESKDFSDERLLHSTATHLVPVYVFDEREIELSGLPDYQRKGPEARTPQCGFWKTGGFRAR